MNEEYEPLNLPEEEVPAPREEEIPAPHGENIPSPEGSCNPVHQTPPEPRPEPVVHRPEPKPRKSHSAWKFILCSLLVIAMIAGSCVTTAIIVSQRSDRQIRQLSAHIDALESMTVPAEAVPIPIVTGDALTPAQVYEMNKDKVVAISCNVQSTTFGRVTTGKSSGSGFILTADGYVVTNHHVIESATAINVVLHDGTTYPATLVGKDSVNDVAVVKVEAENLSPVTLGSSSSLAIGDMVAAIGNPLGSNLNATLTVGYVSGKDRQIGTNNETINMLQTDASINAGNSGGPLFNMYGQVVGITTAKYSGTTSSGASIEGISFAIPIDDVTDIVGDLKDRGYVSSAYLGIICQDMNEQNAAMYNLPMGAYVVSVTEGYCAQQAGIEPKDIIIRLGDTEIDSRSALVRALRQYHAGEATTVTVSRGGEKLTLDIVLDEKPAEETVTAEEMPAEGNFQEWFDFFSDYFGQ